MFKKIKKSTPLRILEINYLKQEKGFYKNLQNKILLKTTKEII